MSLSRSNLNRRNRATSTSTATAENAQIPRAHGYLITVRCSQLRSTHGYNCRLVQSSHCLVGRTERTIRASTAFRRTQRSAIFPVRNAESNDFMGRTFNDIYRRLGAANEDHTSLYHGICEDAPIVFGVPKFLGVCTRNFSINIHRSATGARFRTRCDAAPDKIGLHLASSRHVFRRLMKTEDSLHTTHLASPWH